MQCQEWDHTSGSPTEKKIWSSGGTRTCKEYCKAKSAQTSGIGGLKQETCVCFKQECSVYKSGFSMEPTYNLI